MPIYIYIYIYIYREREREREREMKSEDTSLAEQISSEEYNDEEKQLKSIVSEGMMNPTMCYTTKNKNS